MINFKTDENLGKMVSAVELHSFGLEPMTKFSELVFAAGGYNIGYLCGFKFTSIEQHQNKEFYVSFVSKLRSKIYRQATTNPSQWFMFYKPTKEEIQIISKDTALHLYNFDVNKFFKSDYFTENLPILKKYVLKGLDVYLSKYVKEHGEEKAKGVLTSSAGHSKNVLVKDAYQVYDKSIRDSLKYINITKCNDKDYHLLKMLNINEKEKLTEHELLEKELDDKIEEALKQIYR